MKCKHKNTTFGEDRCYNGSVAVHPYTDENQSAHGGVTYDETCDGCGMERQLNVNGLNTEFSPWGPSASQVLYAENLEQEKYEACRMADDDVALEQSEMEVIDTVGSRTLMRLHGSLNWYENSDILRMIDGGSLSEHELACWRAVLRHS